ncbi:hypothetical protein GCAAIG_10960 [Candidatus Electronema halotolerans]
MKNSIIRFVCTIFVLSFYFFNITYAQAKIGGYCGNCEKEKQELSDAQGLLSLAQETLSTANENLSSASDKYSTAEGLLEFAKQAKERAEALLNNAKQAVAEAKDAILSLKDEITALRLSLMQATAYWAYLQIQATIILKEAALSAAELLLPPLIAAAATAAIVWFDAKQAIPPLKDQVTVAKDDYEKALEKWRLASKDVRDKTKNVEVKKNSLDKCLASRVTPAQCEKCENNKIAANDSEDPGMCKKCQNGAVVNDNSEDPGICKKCQGGSAVTDYSESCNDFDPCTEGDHCTDDGCAGTPIENPSPSSPECQ